MKKLMLTTLIALSTIAYAKQAPKGTYELEYDRDFMNAVTWIIEELEVNDYIDPKIVFDHWVNSIEKCEVIDAEDVYGYMSFDFNLEDITDRKSPATRAYMDGFFQKHSSLYYYCTEWNTYFDTAQSIAITENKITVKSKGNNKIRFTINKDYNDAP